MLRALCLADARTIDGFDWSPGIDLHKRSNFLDGFVRSRLDSTHPGGFGISMPASADIATNKPCNTTDSQGDQRSGMMNMNTTRKHINGQDISRLSGEALLMLAIRGAKNASLKRRINSELETRGHCARSERTRGPFSYLNGHLTLMPN